MNPIETSSQVLMDFRPGLAERFDTVLECISAGAHSNLKPLKTIASNMDMSPSDLSRKLAHNPDDPRRFSVGDLEKYIQVTGDTTPISYLAQKYCMGADEKQKAALTALAGLAPQLQALLKAAGVAQ